VFIVGAIVVLAFVAAAFKVLVHDLGSAAMTLVSGRRDHGPTPSKAPTASGSGSPRPREAR
jgi:hypothetical protein